MVESGGTFNIASMRLHVPFQKGAGGSFLALGGRNDTTPPCPLLGLAKSTNGPISSWGAHVARGGVCSEEEYVVENAVGVSFSEQMRSSYLILLGGAQLRAKEKRTQPALC